MRCYITKRSVVVHKNSCKTSTFYAQFHKNYFYVFNYIKIEYFNEIFTIHVFFTKLSY